MRGQIRSHANEMLLTCSFMMTELQKSRKKRTHVNKTEKAIPTSSALKEKKRIRSYLIQKSEGIFRGLWGRWVGKGENLVKTWQGRGRCGRMESGKNLAGKKELWDSTWSQDSGKINSWGLTCYFDFRGYVFLKANYKKHLIF